VPELPGEITGIITALLNRLQAPANHGITVETALSYLSSARRGLTENEILEILYSDPEYQKWLKGVATRTGHKLPKSPKRIPVAIWSRLRYDLAPYLTEHSAPGGPVLNFYHRQFGDCVRNLFLDSERKIKAWQGRLADYFDRQNVNLRQADELPYLLRQLDEQNRLRDCLLNIDRFLLMEQTSELELRGYWLWLEEERVMGQAYLKSFEDWAKRPGRRETEISYSANVLALFLHDSALYKEAEPLFRRALAIDEKSFGRDHPTVATDLNNLASLLYETNRHQEAEPLLRRAVEILLEFTRTTGHPHPNLQAVVENYASLLQALGHSPDEMRRNVIELGRRYGVNLSDAIAHVASAPPPKLRAVIEEMMRDQSKIPEIIARLEQEDPALLLELIKWIKSRQS